MTRPKMENITLINTQPKSKKLLKELLLAQGPKKLQIMCFIIHCFCFFYKGNRC